MVVRLLSFWLCVAAAFSLFAENDLIREIEMPPREKRHELYSGVQDISIKGSSFYRGGKPVFVSGAWQLDVEGSGWHHRLFKVNVCTYNPEFVFTCYGLTKEKDGGGRFELKPNPWYDTIINRFLANGVNFWHEHKGNRPAVWKEPAFKDVCQAGHFVPFDPWHPLGIPLYRELYKTWMRYTQNYPVWCYELFNEMIYDNVHAISRDAFREAMQKKYQDIGKANRAWGSSFTSFAEVDAPGYLTDHGEKELARGRLYQTEGRKYPNLLVDWQKFQAERSYEAIRTLMPIMRGYDNDPKVFSTLQSHMNWWLDHTRSGLKPEALTDFSDFLSHEIGVGFIESGDSRSWQYVAKMLRSNMIGDLVRGTCPDKPIFNAESPLGVALRGAPEEELTESDLAAMTSGWTFFDATAALPADWNLEKVDSSGWKPIAVPGMWGKNGHPKCQVGVYRKEFTLTGEQLSRPVFLNGAGLADSGEIYLNGKPVGTVKGFNTPFTFDISALAKRNNVIAVKLENRYFEGGMYYGGIRGFISVNGKRQLPEGKAAFEPRHYRAFYWSQVVHGMNGIMFSYNQPQHTMGARSIPLITQELGNVADLLFQKENQPESAAALLYPRESMMTIIHKDYLQSLEGPATIDLIPWYAALACNGYQPRVIRAVDLGGDRAAKLKLIVMPNNPRVSKEAYRRLCDFVRAGGTLVTNYGSLAIDDDTHEALDSSELTGVVPAAALELTEYKVGNLGSGKLANRFLDNVRGMKFTLKGAESRLRFADGTPALTRNRYGRGWVYMVAGNFRPEHLTRIIVAAAKEQKLAAPWELLPYKKAFKPEFTDGKVYTGADGSRLVYLLNYDLSGAALLRLPEVEGSFRLRNVENGRPVPSPSGKEFWSGGELKSGIPVALRQFSPVVLLLEPTGSASRVFKGISPTRLAMLNELWKKPEHNEGGPVVGQTPLSLLTMEYGTLPTAHRLLTDHGFNLKNLKSGDSYEGLDVVFHVHPRDICKEPEKLLEFVRNGGGLFLTGGPSLNYHTTSRNPELMKAFKLNLAYIPAALYRENPPLPAEDAMNVHCTDMGSHPVMAGVRDFVTAGAGFLTKVPPGATLLFSAPRDCNNPGKPVAVAFEYGKGRVVFVPDYWFFRPIHLDRGDNAQFLLNAMAWLAKKPGITLSEEARKRSLFITRERLEQAEREEREGVFTFEAPATHATWLDDEGSKQTQGIAGGDPIVDALNNW